MRLNKNDTTVEKLEYLRELVRNEGFCTDSGLVEEIQEAIKNGHWLKQSGCCGVQGCCDNTSASY